MNQNRFTSLLFSAAVVLFFTSCGGNEDKTNTDTTTTDTAANATPPPPASTIVTTPQDMMVVTHKVANFAKWKPVYDADDSLRLANGIHSYVIGRGWPDSNKVLVAVKVDNMDKAKAFAKDPALKKAMQKSGVTGAPSIMFVTMTFQDTATIGSQLRTSTTFTVKDWDTWKTAFEASTQERADNGLKLRAYGHEANDNHKVRVVMALMDTAKAFAYWKSDALKKRMAESGVIGQPERFIYQIVQKY
jgi:hypothetical protein